MKKLNHAIAPGLIILSSIFSAQLSHAATEISLVDSAQAVAAKTDTKVVATWASKQAFQLSNNLQCYKIDFPSPGQEVRVDCYGLSTRYFRSYCMGINEQGEIGAASRCFRD